MQETTNEKSVPAEEQAAKPSEVVVAAPELKESKPAAVVPITAETAEPIAVAPQAVVEVLSPRGIEYVFMTICLFMAAGGILSVLIALVNGKMEFPVLGFPVATVLVSGPLFAYLFLRLKKAELAEPQLRQDPSKRRSTQWTQIVTFLTCVFTLVGFVSTLFAKMAGQYSGSLLKVFLNVLVILLVAGGILAYYWFDEHKVRR
ncbi:MAG: hypothetical protein WAQ24_00290 [Candidatus Saccharimonadales bacterium]